MTDINQDLHKFLEMLDCESRKRKYLFGEGDFPPAKRQKLMDWVSKRFQQRCREYHDRKRKILIGLTLYWDSKVRDARRMVRKRPSSELYAEYEGILMAKYPKLVLEPPTPAQVATPVTSAADEAVEVEAVIRSAVDAVEAEAIRSAVDAVETEAVESARALVAKAAAKLEAIVKDVALVETAVISAVEAEVEAAKPSAVETAAKLEADVKDEVSVPPQKRRLIKRLPENVEEKDATESKEVTGPRRKRWRKKGEKRS